MRPAVCLGFLALAACQSGGYVRFAVDGIPAGTTSLAVSSNLRGREAPIEVFPLTGTTLQTLALHLPSDASGWFEVGVAAKDAGNCDLAWQATSFAPAVFDSNLIDVALPLAPVAHTCGLRHFAGMMYVPAGSFTIGCDPAHDTGCFDDERPAADVALDGFEIDQTEVSVGEYDDCVQAQVCARPLETTPLPINVARDAVDWARATAYCAWRGKRLPSEAEWEAAARGTDGRIYPWGDEAPTCALANFSTGTGVDAACGKLDRNQDLIGQRPDGRSPYGVFDLAGNLAEWVADFYAPRAALGPDDLLKGPTGGTTRVTKGGSIYSFALGIRASYRFETPPDGSDPTGTVDPAFNSTQYGFRCAR